MRDYTLYFETDEEYSKFNNLIMDNLSINNGLEGSHLEDGRLLIEGKNVIQGALDARLKLHGHKFPTKYLEYIKNKEREVGTSLESFFLAEGNYEIRFIYYNDNLKEPFHETTYSKQTFNENHRFELNLGNDYMDPTDFITIDKYIILSKIRYTLVKNFSFRHYVNLMEINVMHKVRINIIIPPLPYQGLFGRIFNKRAKHVEHESLITCTLDLL